MASNKTAEAATRRPWLAVNGLKRRLLHGLKHYLLSLGLIWLAISFYRYNSYYANFLTADTQKTLLWLALAYTAGGFIYYLVLPLEKLPKSRGYVLANMLRRTGRDFRLYLKHFTTKPGYALPKLDREEKVALMFVLVKIFFLPLMIQFLYNNYSSLTAGLNSIESLKVLFSIAGFNNVLFPLLFSLLLFIDTAIFTFGYLVESKLLGSRVRSVEPTALGWIVALMCYPPFSGLTNNYAGWYANDYVYVASPDMTFAFRLAVLVLMAVYAWASVALGPKASNLTNRGIVARGPYRYVRHPAYIAKNLAWWVTVIPVFSLAAVLSMAFWSLIYFLRAITEERHLIRDPDYQAYCRKVRWRFIPKVY